MARESNIFISAEKKESMRRWSDRFRVKTSAKLEDVDVHTCFGETHVLLAGPNDAKPLVLLHGALASSAHMLTELGPLLQTRRIYAVDVIGQSPLSEDRRIEVRDQSYGKWLVEVCDGLGLSEFDLYGVSWGGFVALRALKQAPLRIGHLVLVYPAGVVGNSAWAGFRDAGRHFLMYKLFPSPSRLSAVIQATFTTVDSDWSAYFGEALLSFRLDVRIPPIAKLEEFHDVRCPILVYGGENDASFPGVALLDRIRQLFPQAQTELIRGSKHCPPLTDEFRAWSARRVESFLATLSIPSVYQVTENSSAGSVARR